MLRVIVISLVFTTLSIFLKGNNRVDSVRSIIDTTKEVSLKIKALNKLSEYYIDINRDSAFVFARQALNLALKNKDKMGEIKSYKAYGIAYFYSEKFKLARKYFKKALLIALNQDEGLVVTSLYYLIGATYYNEDNYVKALWEYKKALSIAKDKGYHDMIAHSYNAIGILYKVQGDYKTAIKYYLKALKLAEKNNNTDAIANLYNNIGVLYKNQELYDEALTFYSKSLSLQQKNNKDLSNVLYLYNNIGEIYKLKKSYNKALKYYNKALDIAQKIKSNEGLFTTYQRIANLYKEQKQYDKAIAEFHKALSVLKTGEAFVEIYKDMGALYLAYSEKQNKTLHRKYLLLSIDYSLKAYNEAEKINDFEIKRDAVETLMRAYQQMGNVSKALAYALSYIELNKKIYDIEKLKVTKELEKKYNNEKNKLLIEKLEKEKELRNQKAKSEELSRLIRKRQIKLLVIGIILLLIFLIYIYRNLLKNKKLNRALKVLNSELDNKTKEIKLQYLESVKQNIEINTKAHEIDKQKQIILEKNEMLQDLNNQLIASEEELKQQNDILFQKNEEIQQQQEIITEVIRQFEDTIENLEDVYFKTNRHFRYMQVSPSMQKHLNLNSIDDIIGKPLNTYWIISNEENKSLTKQLLRGEPIKKLLIKYKTTDNKTRYGKINARALFTDGRFSGVEGIIRDVTSEIEYQNRIKEAVRQFEDTIENLEDIYFKTNSHFRYVQVSPSMQKHLNLNSIDDIIGKPLNTYWIISNEENENLTKQLLRGEPVRKLLLKYKTTDNKVRYGHINARALFTDGRFSGVEGIIRDVTSEIEYQNRIKEAVRQFEDTVENLEDIYFKTNRQFMQIQVSPSVKKYLGLSSLKEIQDTPLDKYWITTTEEKKSVIKELIKKKSLKDLLFRYKTENHEVRYGRLNARALFTDGRFSGVEGIIRDVTSDIEYQNKILELSKQKQVLINNLPAMIYYKDVNLRYIEINNHFAKSLGKEPNEIIGKTDEELLSDNQFVQEYEGLDKEVIQTKQPILDYQKQHIGIDNEIYWTSTSKIPYLDKQNNVTGIVGIVRDITEQIEYEKTLKESKDKIEEAHKHITDNINYAKKIQQALLPTQEIIDGYFEENFVLYLPKDRVSGDFYFLKKIEDHIIFAVADCTGHGVSGGFLTMLGITNLNDIVTKNNIANPGRILNRLREKFKKTYTLFGSENKDGLDIALCSLNTKTNELVYSGAFNPLWIIRNHSLMEYKATRNPIGFYVDNEQKFTNQKIQVEENDLIYLFSDGFADQFGGETIRGKKYSSRQFKQFLISINEFSLDIQKQRLTAELKKWQGDNEQIDDITILGIRIK